MKVKFYGSLSKGIGGEITVDMPAGSTLSDLLKQLHQKNPEISPDNPDLIIFINDAESHLSGGLKAKLNESDAVSILPAAHGG
ncbi:MAG: MoaD/ThiS family protein [Nitrososphaerota archaeon]|nr:MoaD/ThiS family protein [Nitrososphaerota archaeon]MDG6935718.1 MoaD/ThiS family protein [Nitrososphaerota archaeon]